MKKLLCDVLKEIKPSKEEENLSRQRIRKVVDKISKLVTGTRVVLGGSGEKGTWLRDAHDADIFVLFPKGSKNISDTLEKKISKQFKLERLHGSRDYFQTIVEGFTFEIVPIIAIKKADEAENITDVSPLHADWVKKNAKFADEIRLAKQFFKSARAYGAESYISGFSGYMCEVLTIAYKGFPELIKAIASWKPKTIVDVAGTHKGKNILFELDKSKTTGPLVVVDPVQPTRNAAAAVSLEKYDRIRLRAKNFLKKPSQTFFDLAPLDKKSLLGRAGKNNFFFLTADPLEGKRDIVGCKLLKVYEYLREELTASGFSIKESGWDFEKKGIFYFMVPSSSLSEQITVRGPPAKMQKHAEHFRKAHKKVFEEKGILFAYESRKHRKALGLIKELINRDFVNERVRRILL